MIQPWGPRLEAWWQALRRRLTGHGYSWTPEDEKRLWARVQRIEKQREKK